MVGLVSSLFIGALTRFFLLSPPVGVAVVAWHRGCRASPVLVGALLTAVALLPDASIISIGDYSSPLYTRIDFVPAYVSVLVIGVEWLARERRMVTDFLRTRLGTVSVLLGVTNVVIGYVVQIRARDYLFEWVPLVWMDGVTLRTVMNTFGFSLSLVSLLVVVVLPAFLWHTNRLLTPVAVTASWLSLAVWMNYLWWNAHPVSEIRGLGAFPLPAPDYALNTAVLLLLVLLVSILELAYRGRGEDKPTPETGATRTGTDV